MESSLSFATAVQFRLTGAAFLLLPMTWFWVYICVSPKLSLPLGAMVHSPLMGLADVISSCAKADCCAYSASLLGSENKPLTKLQQLL